MYEEYKDILATTASICTILQFLSPVLICRKFFKNGSVGETSALPYIAGFLSCSLWLRYGYLLDDTSIKIVNTSGVILQFIYVSVYCYYSARKVAVMRQFIFAFLIILTVMAFIGHSSDDILTAKKHLGLICCIVTIIFFTAPFATLAHVIKVKNAESLPFSLIFANLIVSALWFMYGLILQDPYIKVTNFLGCVLSGLQLLLFAIYPSTSNAPKKSSVIQQW